MKKDEAKEQIVEWLKGYASECETEFCDSCNFGSLCNNLDDCAPRIIVEIIERQQAEIRQTELRVLENFINRMPKTYRKRTQNWVVVEHILLMGTFASGGTSCCEKCRELGIDPYGFTLERAAAND